MKPSEVTKINKLPLYKNKTLIIAVSIILIALIFFGGIKVFKKDTIDPDYATQVEEKLVKMLSKIKGVGRVSVVVSLEDFGEEILAKNVETKIENGVKSTIETVIFVSGKPYVTKVLTPKIKSVTVVCKGASDISVKMAITECVTSAYSLRAERVKILKMK